MNRPLAPIHNPHGESVNHRCACGNTYATYLGMFPRNWTSVGQEKFCNRTDCRSRADMAEKKMVEEAKKAAAVNTHPVAKIKLARRAAA